MRARHRPIGFLTAALLALADPAFAAADQAVDPKIADEPLADRLQPPGDRPLDSPTVDQVDPNRFGHLPDAAYGAFQRGYYITAHNLALPRAENGDPAAQTLVAEIYARGLGMPRDAKKAAQWYAKAAEQGVPEAQFQYALMLLDGTFVGKDSDRAYELMRIAADSGNRLAQFNLAQMMLDRHPGLESEKRAVGYYEKAANAGLADAQYAMAQVYANGFGGKAADDRKARDWLLRSATQGFDTAQLDLGTWMVDGRGGPRDTATGFNWLKRAAEGGNIAAQNRLAKLYRAGVGTEPRPREAAAWYISARRAGLIDREMEDFLAGLTPEEMKEAIQRANRLR
ncbi:tetratricopeptide repeat protein [Nitratireductor sp. ZSWI3]|uniref:tetratricopeptide repeat protein n=1 Tax=Nitratireductor sp. ZSWI3 TaxID=2966359 RepID=UPI002150172E|nr:tetratricopeptide repeat protein [Nitratireductor sp. ZSWI3]MCR4267251.1 sel1 repeat family protein [Nitratireductor sp. ZSWI3]